MSDPFSALRARFRAQAAKDLEQLTEIWNADRTSPDLRRIIHDLAGAAGVLGFPALSFVALEIDSVHGSGRQPDSVQIDQLFMCLREVANGALSV